MNIAVIMGRLTADPKVRTTSASSVANYTLAVDRRGEGTDYINIAAFGKGADFADKYFKKGMRVLVSGRIQTGSYTNKDGNRVNTFEIVADNQEFADSKKTEQNPSNEFVAVDDDFSPF